MKATRRSYGSLDSCQHNPCSEGGWTTGKPKGCVQFHRDILAPADAFARHILAPEPNDRWLCTAPIAFTFGLGIQLIFPWRFGGTAATVETIAPPALVEAIEQFGVTIFGTAPTAYKAMLGMTQQIRPRSDSASRRRAFARDGVARATRRDEAGDHRRYRRDRNDAHLRSRSRADIDQARLAGRSPVMRRPSSTVRTSRCRWASVVWP